MRYPIKKICGLLLLMTVMPGNAGFLFNLEIVRAEVTASIDPATADRISMDLSNSLMSPFCPGMTISGCPSPNARELRDRIRSMALAGNSSRQIETQLISEFGAVLMSAPAPKGFGLTAWTLPFVFLLLGVAVIVAVLRNSMLKAPPGKTAHEPQAEPAEKLTELDDEVRRRLL
jgi:cytochrome c-type biogenesis protein CcmH/NrfF